MCQRWRAAAGIPPHRSKRSSRAQPAPCSSVSRPTPAVSPRSWLPARPSPPDPGCRPGRLPQTRAGRVAGIGRGVTFRPRAWPTGPGQRREHGRNRRIEGFMFPDPDDVPAGCRERGVRHPVSLDVPPQLGLPVPGVVGRLAAMLRTGVPEAAIHEHGDATRGERDVGPDPLALSQVEPVVLAEPVPLVVQRPAQRDLGLGVRAPDRAHVGCPSLAGRVRVLGHGPQRRAPPPAASAQPATRASPTSHPLAPAQPPTHSRQPNLPPTRASPTSHPLAPQPPA